MMEERSRTGQRTVHTGIAGVPPASEDIQSTAKEEKPPKGWHSRGYLPHFDVPGLVQSISFHLADSVPAEVVAKWKAELNWRADLPPSDPAVITLHRRIEKYADAGYGECYLRQPPIAESVQSALLYFDFERYHLLSWCIMPNHVHALVEIKVGWAVRDVIHSWKSYSAKCCNRLIGRSGQFWMEDYFDRYVRDAEHYAAVVAYIEENPVKAKLVRVPGDWQFSSAAYAAGGRDARDPSISRLF